MVVHTSSFAITVRSVFPPPGSRALKTVTPPEIVHMALVNVGVACEILHWDNRGVG